MAISPHTPPGTKIVCVQESILSSLQLVLGVRKPTIGAAYTVRGMIFCPVKAVPGVLVVEITNPVLNRTGLEIAYALDTFDLAALPKCLTEIPERVRRQRELTEDPA